MKKVALFSCLLCLGLILSQFTMYLGLSRDSYDFFVKNLTLICLGWIMIQVGLEFSIEKNKIRSYGWDYFVAFTAASFPWILASFYFVFSYGNPRSSSFDVWADALLLGRFASPTSAGVLFAMLAAAGLASSWVFRKARILAIFDDLDTILLLIPIKMMIIGFKWELLLLLFIIAALFYLAWKKMRSFHLPVFWKHLFLYSVLLVLACEGLYLFTNYLENVSPLQIEILLPAFVFGCIIAYPKGENDFHKVLALPNEKRAHTWISAFFMFLVGASMPSIDWSSVLAKISIGSLLVDVAILTILSNLGKMFPLLCYKKEASLKERFALSLSMCPRGEVGAGVILVSLGLISHLSQEAIVVAMFSLAVNLIFTGPLIWCVQKLLNSAVISQKNR